MRSAECQKVLLPRRGNKQARVPLIEICANADFDLGLDEAERVIADSRNDASTVSILSGAGAMSLRTVAS